LIVGGGDGGNVTTGTPTNWKEQEAAEGRYTDDTYMSGGNASDVVGFGRAAPPPAYSGSSVGEPIEGSKVSDVKR